MAPWWRPRAPRASGPARYHADMDAPPAPAAALAPDVELIELGGVWVHRSIPALYQRYAAARSDRVGEYHREDGVWRSTTVAQGARRVRRLTLGLLELGVEPGDRVGLVCSCRPEWGAVDMAILHAGAVTVGVYPSLVAAELAYPLHHAGVAVAVVEDAEQLGKLLAERAELPDLRAVVVIDPPEPLEGPAGLELLSLDALAERGEAAARGDERFAAAWQAVGPDDLATIIYTSGTTGPPKGALLAHGSLTFTAQSTASVLPHAEDDVSVVFLPPAHALQRVAGYAGLHTGATGYFAESHLTLMDDIREVEPTIQVSVPRIWEKMHARVLEGVAAAPARRRRIFEWALATGRRAAPYRREGRRPPLGLRLAHAVARRVVHDPLRRRVFGDRIRYLTSGGAPIDVEVLEFFEALGLLILEGWGLTETAAPATVNRPDAYRFGTVGQAIPGVEVKAAPDGELLVRGPGVFQGYYRDEEATAAAFDPDGFFRTGDVGEVDADGFVRITDRKKNLIVTAQGKNVAPQDLENAFKTIPLVGDCLVVGDRRPYLVGLLVLDPEEALAWARARGHVPPAAGSETAADRAARLPELAALPALREHLDAEVAARNAGRSRHEQLKRWTLLPVEWTVEGGALTPTLKTKRRVIEARHADEIERLYAG